MPEHRCDAENRRRCDESVPWGSINEQLGKKLTEFPSQFNWVCDPLQRSTRNVLTKSVYVHYSDQKLFQNSVGRARSTPTTE